MLNTSFFILTIVMEELVFEYVGNHDEKHMRSNLVGDAFWFSFLEKVRLTAFYIVLT